MIGVEIELHGAFLTTNPLPAVDQFIEDSTWYVAAQGLAYWHQNLDRSLRNPTPIYETKLMLERQTAERVDAHDQGMVYGGWLEGTSARNRTTQFKGYKGLRLAAQQLERTAPRVVQPYLELLIRRLGGA